MAAKQQPPMNPKRGGEVIPTSTVAPLCQCPTLCPPSLHDNSLTAASPKPSSHSNSYVLLPPVLQPGAPYSIPVIRPAAALRSPILTSLTLHGSLLHPQLHPLPPAKPLRCTVPVTHPVHIPPFTSQVAAAQPPQCLRPHPTLGLTIYQPIPASPLPSFNVTDLPVPPPPHAVLPQSLISQSPLSFTLTPFLYSTPQTPSTRVPGPYSTPTTGLHPQPQSPPSPPQPHSHCPPSPHPSPSPQQCSL
uniref:Uncharacterized protein n=1 Tax=Pelodiscus sinensis TaxID=13735 RepID=K7EZ95_PELSI